MGQAIPPIFVRGRWDADTPLPTDWNEVIALLPDGTWTPRGPLPLTSRNGWCEALISRVAQGLGLVGLEFLDSEEDIDKCVVYVIEAQDRKDRDSNP